MKKIILMVIANLALTSQSQVLWKIDKDKVTTFYYSDGDEFNGEYTLKEKWDPSYGWARSIAANKEQQYYSDFENHIVKDGCLNLTVTKKTVNAKLVDWMKDNDTIVINKKSSGLNKRNFNYMSGMISSRGEFLRGYFEIKFKAPSEKGLWPAFWLYGGTPNEEIDFFELKGERPDQVHIDTHCPDRCDYSNKFPGVKRSFGGWIKLNENLTDGFNIVSGVWDDNEIRYYLNGQCIAISKVTFNAPKKLVANVAVPSDDGPFKPGPDASVENFSPFVIDYIRVWTKDAGEQENFIANPAENVPSVTNTVIKRKKKFLYGKKKDHEQDGIFLSMIKTKSSIDFFANGLDNGEAYDLKITDASQKIIFSEKVSSREFRVPVKPQSGYQIEIIYNNRTINQTL